MSFTNPSIPNIRDRIVAGEFENILPYPTDIVLINDPAYQQLDAEESQSQERLQEIQEAKKALIRAMRKEYDLESAAKKLKFKEALEEEYGLQDHPKKDDVWNKAWEDGHSGGWASIYYEYEELAELVT